MHVIGVNSNDGFVLVLKNARDEVFYLCDSNKCIKADAVGVIVIFGKDALFFTKCFDYAAVEDTFDKVYNKLEDILEFSSLKNYGYICEIGKLYRQENLIVTY